MSKREKLRQRLRQHPANASMQDIQTLLERFGFSLARIRGSNYIYEYDNGNQFARLLSRCTGAK
jgi:virulence-associated protein VapD